MKKAKPRMTKLEKIMKDRNITVQQLAFKTHIPQSTISSYVTGARNINKARVYYVMAICEVLKVDIKEVI